MGGAFRWRVRIFLTITCGCAVLFGSSLTAIQAGNPPGIGDLEFVKDTIDSTVPNRTLVFHNVSFTLPTTAQQVTPSDWITINLPNYYNITAPGDLIGSVGTPTYVAAGHTLQITNIALLPGDSMQIIGFTATNPPEGFDTTGTIYISAGQDGTGTRNQATFTPSQDTGFIEVSAVVRSPLAEINITGFSSPETFITLDENGTVVATTTTDTDGTFAFPITGLDPGEHDYRITGSDPADRSTSAAVIQLFLLGGTLTTASGIILSPTIQIDKSQINPGDPLTVSGAAKPSSQINIFTESPLRSYTATTDTNGNWSYIIPSEETSKYIPGEYRIYANVQDDIGNQSMISPTITFDVVSPNSGDNPPPACDISTGDLNCDGKVNLVDFSILLFHWHTNHKVADINGDGSVNLVDFSIMMFYFKR